MLVAFADTACTSIEQGSSYSNSEQSCIDEFRAEYRWYEIPHEGLPDLPRRLLDSIKPTQEVWRDAQRRLSLTLGPREAANAPRRFRTGSRYVLSNGGGAPHEVAESVLALEDVGSDLGPAIRIEVFSDPETQALLIVEEHSWSVNRLIVVTPELPSAPATLIRIPERRGESPIRHYEVSGFRGGAVYVRQDGRNYRFPVRTLKQERDLSYSIG